MSTVREVSPDHWEVHLASKDQSEVMVEVHMSRATARKIAELETARVARLNPEHEDLPEWSPGASVLNVLGLYAANGSIK